MSIKLEGEALAPFLHLLQQYDTYVAEKNVSSLMSLFVPDEDTLSFGLRKNTSNKEALKQRFIDYFQSDKLFRADKIETIVYQYGESACMYVCVA